MQTDVKLTGSLRDCAIALYRDAELLFKVTAVILGAFAKLRKVNISIVMSVGMEQLGSQWTFHEI
jgi:hypothetical protein